MGPSPDRAGNETGADDGSRSPSGLGPALRRAWIGYQTRLAAAMAEAGFAERRFPDGRVLRLCAGHAGSTISAIGRELDITRQGASKVVEQLRDRGYVIVADSATSKREKSVVLTPRGVEYLDVQRAAARAIEEEVRAAQGEAGFLALQSLLDLLDDAGATRLRTYLRRSAGL
jgi:DNA-binding MarR family transcriptional regulator